MKGTVTETATLKKNVYFKGFPQLCIPYNKINPIIHLHDNGHKTLSQMEVIDILKEMQINIASALARLSQAFFFLWTDSSITTVWI